MTRLELYTHNKVETAIGDAFHSEIKRRNESMEIKRRNEGMEIKLKGLVVKYPKWCWTVS
jgi:hypothetical protein